MIYQTNLTLVDTDSLVLAFLDTSLPNEATMPLKPMSVPSSNRSAPVKSATERAADDVRQVGVITANDDQETRLRKLNALWSLSDAMIADGMETWSTERVLQEVAILRGNLVE